MKQRYILTEPSDTNHRATDEYYNELDNGGWLAKSKRLQARRWHKLRNENRDNIYHFSHKIRGMQS